MQIKDKNYTLMKYRTLNEPEKETLKRIKKLANSCRWIDLKFRDNGGDKILQADFLREILKQI